MLPSQRTLLLVEGSACWFQLPPRQSDGMLNAVYATPETAAAPRISTEPPLAQGLRTSSSFRIKTCVLGFRASLKAKGSLGPSASASPVSASFFLPITTDATTCARAAPRATWPHCAVSTNTRWLLCRPPHGSSSCPRSQAGVACLRRRQSPRRFFRTGQGANQPQDQRLPLRWQRKVLATSERTDHGRRRSCMMGCRCRSGVPTWAVLCFPRRAQGLARGVTL